MKAHLKRVKKNTLKKDTKMEFFIISRIEMSTMVGHILYANYAATTGGPD